MLRKSVFLLLLGTTAALWVARSHGHSSSGWRRLSPSLEVRQLQVEGTSVLAFRTAPSSVHVVTGALLTASEWRSRQQARAAVNGGFFDPLGKPVGLIISRGALMRRLRHGSGGVFLVQRGKARIMETSAFAAQFHGRMEITEAIECGPVLVENGHVNRLKPQTAARTGIGVQSDGRIVLAVTDGSLSLPSWAQLWADPNGLSCRDALNLDGGPSTQASVRAGSFSQEIEGGWPVPDAVLIR